MSQAVVAVDLRGKGETSMVQKALCFGVAVMLCASVASAAVVPGDLTYAGSFKLPSSLGNYGWGALAYDNGASGEVIYWSAGSTINATDIPALLDPGVVGWDNLNVGTVQIGPASFDRPGGLRIRDDSGTQRLYGVGKATWYRSTLDLSGPTNLGDSDDANIMGLTQVPAGFISYLETVRGDTPGEFAAYDTLQIATRYGGPDLVLLAPQNYTGVDPSVPATTVFWLKQAGGGPWHWSNGAIEWIPDPNDPGNWEAARLLVCEKDDITSEFFIGFYDPKALIDSAAWGGTSDAPPDEPAGQPRRPDEYAMAAYINSPDLTGGRGLCGLTYDPVNKIIYVAEREGDNSGYVHAFQVVPEPATMGLLALGSLGLTALRRRRR